MPAVKFLEWPQSRELQETEGVANGVAKPHPLRPQSPHRKQARTRGIFVHKSAVAALLGHKSAPAAICAHKSAVAAFLGQLRGFTVLTH